MAGRTIIMPYRTETSDTSLFNSYHFSDKNALRGVALACLIVIVLALAKLTIVPAEYAESVDYLWPIGILIAASTGGFIAGLSVTALAVCADSMTDQLIPRAADDPLNIIGLVFSGIFLSVGGHVFKKVLKASANMVKSLTYHQRFIDSVFDTSPDGIVVSDGTGTIKIFNRAAEEQFGWSAQDIIGRNLNVLMPGTYRAAHDDYLARYGETGERKVIGTPSTFSGVRKDGTIFPIEIFIGEPEGANRDLYVGFTKDLTQERSTQNRMSGLEAQLIHATRTSSLGQFGSALAHEINQPLASIYNYLAAAKKGIETGAFSRELQFEIISKAEAEALRAGEIIRNLRSFLARGSFDKTYNDLNQLVDEAVSLALVGSNGAGIHLTKILPEDAGAINCDRIQIQQVVINIVRNAAEALRDCERREIEVATSAPSNGYVELTITDSGKGFSLDQQAHLFKPFMTSKSDGLGLGLAICRTIVENHGGTITAQNSPGGGAQFKIRLPSGKVA
jgi:two-component system sensor kinase FixL